MDITDFTITHHLGIVLLLLRLVSVFDNRDPVPYLISLIYLCMVHERYVIAMQRKLESADQKPIDEREIKEGDHKAAKAIRRKLAITLLLLWFLSPFMWSYPVAYFLAYLVLADSEKLRWLNYAVEKLWSMRMEAFLSQEILPPIINWFLEKYSPPTAKKAVVQFLYLGRNSPAFRDLQFHRRYIDDNHLALELGIFFLTRDSMRAILAVKLRDRLGSGMWIKLHMTGLHVDGRVSIGVKFTKRWPFISRLRVCFIQPLQFQMTVMPIFTKGLDVMEPPEIIKWLDKLLSVALQQQLVQPSAVTIDMERYTSTKMGDWFNIDVKNPIGYIRVEVLKTSSSNLPASNWYVKVRLGTCLFRTLTKKSTSNPTWEQEFKILIVTWDSPNKLDVELCREGYFLDCTFGRFSLDVSALRDGERHNVCLLIGKNRRLSLHLAISVLEAGMEDTDTSDGEESESMFMEEPVGYAHVEVIEATNVQGSFLTARSNACVRGHMETFRFRTSIRHRTLAPKWLEEFRLPILSWNLQNKLALEVLDKGLLNTKTIGICFVEINELRDGWRHYMWLPLLNVKGVRLHLAVTVLESSQDEIVFTEDFDDSLDEEHVNRDLMVGVEPSYTWQPRARRRHMIRRQTEEEEADSEG